MPELNTIAIISENADCKAKIEALLSDIGETESQLAIQKGQFASLQTGFQNFERQYYEAVGILYVQLDEIKAQAAEHQAYSCPQSEEFAVEANTARQIATHTFQEAQSHISSEQRSDQEWQAQPEANISVPKPP